MDRRIFNQTQKRGLSALSPRPALGSLDIERQRIYALWDELADFESQQVDAAADHLMRALCELGRAQNATWISGVRMDPKDDALAGWRVPVVRTLHAAAPEKTADRTRSISQKWERRAPEPAFLESVRGAGRFRHHSLRRAMPARWFEEEHWQRHYAACGVHDVLFVGFPLTSDAESHFSLVRSGSEEAFTDEDIAPVCEALRGIKWFHRRLMISHGQLLASAPLTASDRNVLQALLSGAAEKAIADALGLTYATTHQYVKKVFRKFGVRSRAELMSIWGGGNPRRAS